MIFFFRQNDLYSSPFFMRFATLTKILLRDSAVQEKLIVRTMIDLVKYMTHPGFQPSKLTPIISFPLLKVIRRGSRELPAHWSVGCDSWDDPMASATTSPV